ncbi:MAG: hypothetical protein KJO50_05575, partial [Bacteroidia bacterium]|nr:hypothetical protein [Bacteroidia bacterium]
MSARNSSRVDFPGNFVKYGIYGFLLLMLMAVLSSTTFITISPGQKGVLFKRFAGGIDKDKVYSQGFHVVAPWN